MAAGIEHKLKLQTVGISEKHCVVVGWIIHCGRVENCRTDLLKHPVKAVDLLPTGCAKREMMQAGRVTIVLSIAALRAYRMQHDSGSLIIARRESKILRGVFGHPVAQILHHRPVEE